jgi:hypothetical protein
MKGNGSAISLPEVRSTRSQKVRESQFLVVEFPSVTLSNRQRINSIIFIVCANETDVNNACILVNHGHESIPVDIDIEGGPIIW